MNSCTSPRERNYPFIIRRGSVEVKIYRTPSHGCDRYIVSYYQDGQRKRPSFSTFEDAKCEAEAVAGRLASTDGDDPHGVQREADGMWGYNNRGFSHERASWKILGCISVRSS
jgi:hypothetical protein